MEYHEIMWAERKVDIYSGDNCDEHEAEWHCSAEGGMDSETSKAPLILEASTFMPGAKVVISTPVCPECHQMADICVTDDCCQFDWKVWAENEYA